MHDDVRWILYERASYPEMDGPFVRYYYCSNHRRLAKYVLLWSYFSSKTLKQSNWKIYQGWQCSVNISFCGCIFLLENSKSIKTKMLLLETLKLILLFFLSAGEIMSSVIIFDSLGVYNYNVSNFVSCIRSLEVMRKFHTVEANSTVLSANRITCMYMPNFAMYNFVDRVILRNSVICRNSINSIFYLFELN